MNFTQTQQLFYDMKCLHVKLRWTNRRYRYRYNSILLKRCTAFWGFGHFYTRFILLLLSMLSFPPRHISSGLLKLKELSNCWSFISAPIRCLPERTNQFIMVADPSDSGIESCHNTNVKTIKLIPLHISQESFPQQREMTVLETGSCWQSKQPWRSGDAGWREVGQPFVVWTDHNNLEYNKT